MPTQSHEFVVVGQGLAGTALAWSLLRRGRTVVVVDRERGGCSRLAAGLITPVTGKRLAKSWRWDELYPAAVAFYRAVEADTGASFFHERPALRLFANEAERDEFRRREGTILRGLVRPETQINGEWFAAPFGGFEMPHAARLDVPRYLDASREHFRARGAYLAAEVDPRDVERPPLSLTSPLEGEVGGASPPGGWWGDEITFASPPPASLREATSPSRGEVKRKPACASPRSMSKRTR